MDKPLLRAYSFLRPRRYAATVAEVVKEISARSPAPRALPFFGLDLPEGCGSTLLDRLSDLGIFRVYERVLEIGCGLGGASRWLARHRGCRVVGVTPAFATAAGANVLTRRAHAEERVSTAVAPLQQLPLEPGACTHVWSVESLHRETAKAAILREAFRTLRPGGYVAVQDWMLADGAVAPKGGCFEPLSAYVEALRTSGFIEITAVEGTQLREEDSAIAEIAWERLGEVMGETAPAERRALGALSAALSDREEAVREGRLRLHQVFGRKPA